MVHRSIRQGLLALLALLATPAFAASGLLDPSFGTGGVVRMDLGLPASARIAATNRQVGGKVVVAGTVPMPSAETGVLLGRFNLDGSLDTTFGSSGWTVLTSGLTEPTEVRGLAFRSDDSIVVLVKSGARTGFGLRQANGQPYQTSGLPEPDVRLDDWSANIGFEPRALAVSNYGYYVAGSAPADPATERGRDSFVAMFSPSFTIYSSARYSVGAGDDEALAILAGFNEVFIAGRTREPGASQDAYVARIGEFLYPELINATRIDHEGNDDSATVLVRDYVHLLVGGRTEAPGGLGKFLAARIDLSAGYPNLALDTNFGTGGKTVVDMPAIFGGPHDAHLRAVKYRDGRAVLVGDARDPVTNESRVAAAWLDYNGGIIPYYGTADGVAFGFPWYPHANDEIVVGVHASEAYEWYGSDLNVFSRYTAGGFQQLELQRLRNGNFYDYQWGNATAPLLHAWKRPSVDTLVGVARSGNFIYALGTSDDDTVLARFRVDGTLDTPLYPYDPPAIKRLTPAEFTHEPVSLSVDSMGRLVVGARNNGSLVIARFDSALNLDYSFAGGTVVIAAGAGASMMTAAVAADDSIVALGQYSNPPLLVAAKVHSYGYPDPAWSSQVQVYTNVTMSPHAAAFAPDGKLLVAGGVPGGAGMVARVNTDGSLDTGWGGGAGWVSVNPLQTEALLNSLAIAPDGTVYASGWCSDYYRKLFCAAGYRADGTPSDFGVQVVALSGLNDEAVASGLSPEGKLLVAGDSYRTSEFKAIALHADGSRDTGYGPYGVAVSGQYGVAMKGSISPDGRMLLAGETVDDDWIMVQWQAAADSVPDGFAFGSRNDVTPNYLETSAAVTVTGLAVASPIRVLNGTYSIGCTGSFNDIPATISNGQSVCVQHYSGPQSGDAVTTTLYVGGVAGTFTTRVGAAPETTLLEGPPALTNSAIATFTFTSPDAGATFICRLDGGNFEPCTSPRQYSGLADGTHVFAVAAVNSAGYDQTPATHTWTIDATVPAIVIDSQPPYASNSQDATVQFHAVDATSVAFECSLDGAPFAPCVSPVSYTGLAPDVHVFEIRATDAAGNVATLPTRWVIDVQAPDTFISGPTITNAATSTFIFTSDEPSVTFECGGDGGPWLPCSSPLIVDNTLFADGSHPFQVRAKDAFGNVDPTPAAWTLTIDRTAPDTAIGAAPSGTTSSNAAAISFSSPDATATFECRLDGMAFAACTSPTSYAGLADGAHAFEVRARDAAGNVDASPATASWTVDRTAPETTITGGPSGTVTQASASIAFSSPDPGATFECSLDGGAWSACTSPATYAGLGDGTHLFEVRARDGASNVDPSPASRTWTVDTTAPNTTIASGPDAVTSQTGATFTFSSADGVAFACSLDGGAFASCTSPATYAGLAAGSHSFAVYATDAAGNPDPSPATWSWAIDAEAPETTIVSGPTGTVTQTSATLSFTSDDPAATFECRLDGAAFAACTSPVTLSGLSSASHSFEARAKDAAGNYDPTPAVRTWTVDTVAPDTSITAAPAAAVNVTTASFSFTATEATTFECKLDAGAFAACTSPKAYSGVAVGSHTFQVRARDAVGNQDATPATHTWSVDTTAPNTTIMSGPSGGNNPNTAAFAFTSTEGGTFECKLDTAAFAACTTPKTYTGLAKGSHTFQVRARDAAGNIDATPASRSWSVK